METDGVLRAGRFFPTFFAPMGVLPLPVRGLETAFFTVGFRVPSTAVMSALTCTVLKVPGTKRARGTDVTLTPAVVAAISVMRNPCIAHHTVADGFAHRGFLNVNW